jgi:glycosyltransferase involved in cell wall biosynthesis
MQDYLSGLRCYVYTGTQPASYTLGLIEAMWAGVPIVSIGPEEMWVPDLFEGHELANEWSDSPHSAHAMLERFLTDPERAWQSSQWIRDRAEELFDVRKVGRQWREFLGDPRPKVYTLDEALA